MRLTIEEINKKAKEHFSMTNMLMDSGVTEKDLTNARNGFVTGYNLALKNNVDKKYSDTDLIVIISQFHKMNMAYLTGKEDDNLDIEQFVEMIKNGGMNVK